VIQPHPPQEALHSGFQRILHERFVAPGFFRGVRTTTRGLLTAFKLAQKRGYGLIHIDPWLPSQSLAKFLIGVSVPFPFGGATTPIKDRRKLALGADRILFPKIAQEAAQKIRRAQAKEWLHFIPVSPKQLAAGGRRIIHDIKNLPIYARLQTRQHNGLGAIVNISQGQAIGATQMDEKTESIDAHAPSQSRLAGAKDRSRTKNDVRQLASAAIFLNQ